MPNSTRAEPPRRARVLVTGAGDGIGRAIARLCAEHGATAMLLGRTVEKLERVYDEIRSAGGPEPAIYPMDLAARCPRLRGARGPGRERARTPRRSRAQRRPPRELGPIEHSSPEGWQELIQVNVNAPFLLTRALLPSSSEPRPGTDTPPSSSPRRGSDGAGAPSGAGTASRSSRSRGSTRSSPTSSTARQCARQLPEPRAGPDPDAGEGVSRRGPRDPHHPEEAARAWLWLLDARNVHGEALEAQLP